MRKIFRYPVVVVSIITIITVFLGYNIRHVVIDNDAMSFLPEDNYRRVAMDAAEEIFGSSDNISLGIEAKRGSIFTAEAIDLIKDLTEKIELLPNVEEVQSITNSDFIDGVDGSIVVDDLVGDFTGSEEDVKLLKDKILSWDVYQNLLVSNDFTASQIVITLDKDIEIEGKTQVYEDLRSLVNNIDSNEFNYHIAGVSAVNVMLSTNMQADLRGLIPFVIIILLVALFLSFRRLSGIVLPMLTVVISTVWTVGLMGLLGIPMSMLGTIIPVLMMAVGSAYGIHVISHYYDDIKDFKGELTKDVHEEIILKSLSYVRKPIFLAGITTIAGFASLSVSSVIPMRNFGIFTAIGIVFALIVALTLIPSLLIFNYRSASRKKNRVTSSGDGNMEKGLVFYYDSFGKRKILILFLTTIIIIISALGTRSLIIDSSMIENFKQDTHIRISDRFLRDKFSGTNSFNIMFNGPGAGVDPILLKEMDNLAQFITEEYEEVRKVVSFTDTVKRINQVMHVESANSDMGLEDDFPSDEFSDEEFDTDFGSFYFDSNETEEEFTIVEVETVEFGESTESDGALTDKDFMTLLSKAYANSDNPNISALELMNLLKRETNHKGSYYYEIPFDPAKYGHDEIEDLSELLSQYYSLSGRLEGYIGDNDDFLFPENVRMTVMIDAEGNSFMRELEPVILDYIETYFPKGYSVKLAGNALASDATTQLVTSSAMNSVMLSLLIVFIILSVAFKSAFAGLFGVIPLGVTVLFNYGIMGIFGIKLDMSTAMVGSIAVGIGIDYTIHFISSYTKFSKIESCIHNATKRSLKSSGKAIIFNALSVAAGFTVLVRSSFNPLMYLGILITITMLISSMASITVMPAILNTFRPKFANK